jgi:hypothetical protein
VQIRPSASVVNGRRYVKNFDTFFDKLIKHEGGFTDGERYPGNQLAMVMITKAQPILV